MGGTIIGVNLVKDLLGKKRRGLGPPRARRETFRKHRGAPLDMFQQGDARAALEGGEHAARKDAGGKEQQQRARRRRAETSDGHTYTMGAKKRDVHGLII